MADLLTQIEIQRPAILKFGAGTVGEVGAFAQAQGFRRALVVADAFNADRVGLLGLSGEVSIFGRVVPEPDVANLDDAVAAADAFGPDIVIGFGGGSAMDLAKLVAVLHRSEQKLVDIVGPEKVLGRRVALVQVPTTAGTGSEAGTRALVTDPKTSAKLAVQSRFMLADLAVIDPDLTLTVPRHVTAETGIDALAHCVEAYTNRKAHPLVDIHAIEGIRLVGRFLGRAVADGGDREARAGLALASLYGGYCLGPVNTAGGHAVAYPLGTRRHISHGAANAVIFPHVLGFNTPSVPERTAAILAALGLAAASSPDEVLATAYGYCTSLDIEMRMSRRGVPETDLGTMADEAFAIRRLLDNNPRDLARDDILALYRAAF